MTLFNTLLSRKKSAPNFASFQTCFPPVVPVLGEPLVWEAGASGAGGVNIGDIKKQKVACPNKLRQGRPIRGNFHGYHFIKNG